MTVEYLLLLISIFLIIRELFPETDKFHPRVRRAAYVFLIFVLFILSVVNIYNKNEENEDLINTAKNILERTDSITNGLSVNYDNIINTVNELNNLDTLLNKVNDTLIGQVNLIKEAVSKSKELTALEQKKLLIGSPNIRFFGDKIEIKINPLDSNLAVIYYELRNLGARSASDIRIENLVVARNQLKELKNIYLNMSNSAITIDNISGGNVELRKLNIKFKFDKEKLKENYREIMLVIKLTYTDLAINKTVELNQFYNARYLHLGNEEFYIASEEEELFVRQYLKELKLDRFLVP